MIAIGLLFVCMLRDYFKSRPQLEAEIVILRHQLNLLQRRAPRRPYLRWVDRALFIWLYRRCPRVLRAITIVRPETVLRWHRMGFAAYWRWKSRSAGGRPPIAKEVRDLIRRMSLENPIWGATKIHGELLKLGIQVAQSTVSIYMVPRSDRPSQTWKTFVRNHMDGIASIDLFVVPTISFQQLFAFLVLGHKRRQLLWFAVTRNPTAEWLARQITEAFPWDRVPKYLIRDNDKAFGVAFKARVRAMGIRDRPTSFRSPCGCFFLRVGFSAATENPLARSDGLGCRGFDLGGNSRTSGCLRRRPNRIVPDSDRFEPLFGDAKRAMGPASASRRQARAGRINLASAVLRASIGSRRRSLIGHTAAPPPSRVMNSRRPSSGRDAIFI